MDRRNLTRAGLALVAALTTVALVAAEALERRIQWHAADRTVRLFDRLRL